MERIYKKKEDIVKFLKEDMERPVRITCIDPGSNKAGLCQYVILGEDKPIIYSNQINLKSKDGFHSKIDDLLERIEERLVLDFSFAFVGGSDVILIESAYISGVNYDSTMTHIATVAILSYEVSKLVPNPVILIPQATTVRKHFGYGGKKEVVDTILPERGIKIEGKGADEKDAILMALWVADIVGVQINE